MRQADGYFRFVDRLKDAIRRRGENISSFEVEQVLLSHGAVANAAAFPVRSSLAEDEVMAAVILIPVAHSTKPSWSRFASRGCPISRSRAISNS